MQENMVSIIIPVYNAEKYIYYALESIVKQTYKNFEVIIIDDCSTDNSIDIVENMGLKNVKIIKLKRHRGVSIARNIGIRTAKGRYLTFLDADDMFVKTKLERQIEFINKKAMIYGSYKYMSSDGKKVSLKIKVPEKTDYKIGLKNCRILTSTCMIDLKKIPKRYCYMPDIMNEDLATWLKILKKGYVAYGQNDVLAYYRKTRKSRSSNKFRTAYFRWKLYKNHEKLSGIKIIYYYIKYIINGCLKRLTRYVKFHEENLQIIVSTQNLDKKQIELLKNKMNVSSDYLIINQTNRIFKAENVICKNEIGLSKSRNCGIKNAKGEIILFADDDIIYDKDYKNIIYKAYDKNPKADIICFYVKSLNNNRKNKKMKSGKIGYLKSMRIVTPEISCKRSVLVKNNLFFDENYGAGTLLNRGEEQIFLYEALKKNLKVVFINKKIGIAQQEKSTWFNKYDKDFFIIQGKIFKKLSNKFYILLILQYAIRKINLYKKDCSFSNAIKYMVKGAQNNFIK